MRLSGESTEEQFISSYKIPETPREHGGSKSVLYTILGTRRLTDEVLHTTFCLVEIALNSLPLTPVSADPCDLNALTPNHFLLENSAGIPSVVGNN